MEIRRTDLSQTHQFSSFFLDYISQQPTLEPFYGRFPTPANFEAQIRERTFSPQQRQTLHSVLTEQYSHLDTKPHQIDSLLDEKTFTVTTGHQLNIFGGPLYLIYKLVTAVNLARRLQEQYPEYRFVPIYWMATEDHDFQEINHFHLFGKKYTWQTGQTGAVGRMNPREMESLLGELPEKPGLFERAYLQQNTLADATRWWANELFGAHGLVCLDADHPQLKAAFRDVMRADMLDHATEGLVNQTTTQLAAQGYKAPVNAREINFFYLADGVRERVVKQGEEYQVLNTDIGFSRAGLEQAIEESPERFSPNVLLRPVYQETLLPNLAYIGGPAEVAYWLQLKALFGHFGRPFPLLMPRNFALIINRANAKKLAKLGLDPEAFFEEEARLKRMYVEKSTAAPLDVAAERSLLEQAFAGLLSKALLLDKSLEGLVGAEKQKSINGLENLEKRLRKAEEKMQETGLSQLLSLKAKLFPEGGLQERTDNFLNFYLNDPTFIDTLLAHLDPFDFRFLTLTDHE